MVAACLLYAIRIPTASPSGCALRAVLSSLAHCRTAETGFQGVMEDDSLLYKLPIRNNYTKKGTAFAYCRYWDQISRVPDLSRFRSNKSSGKCAQTSLIHTSWFSIQKL